MIFDWQEYLSYAEKLIEDGAPPSGQLTIECKYRISVSRAYYAAYNLAADYARECLNHTRSREGFDHKQLADCFTSYYEATKEQIFDDIAEDLKAMRDSRNSADYRANHKITYESASWCVEAASDVISDIISLRSK